MRSSLDYAGFAQLCGRSPIMREIMRAHNHIIPRSLVSTTKRQNRYQGCCALALSRHVALLASPLAMHLRMIDSYHQQQQQPFNGPSSIIVRRCVLTASNKRILYCVVLYCIVWDNPVPEETYSPTVTHSHPS